jgi:hypothetical protein
LGIEELRSFKNHYEENAMTTGKKVARGKLSLRELTTELGNVSKACKIMGYSRQQFFQFPHTAPMSPFDDHLMEPIQL